MSCAAYNSTVDALRNFSATAPIDAIGCTFSADWGLGMGVLFPMFVFGFMGLALATRTRHPGPIVPAAMLSATVLAANVPGMLAKILALVIMTGIAVAGYMIYQRAQSSL